MYRACIRRIRRKVERQAGEEGNVRRGSTGRSVGEPPNPVNHPAGVRDASLSLGHRSTRSHDIVDHEDTRTRLDLEAAPQYPPAGLAPLGIDVVDTQLAGDLIRKDDAARRRAGHELGLKRSESLGDHRRQLGGRPWIPEDAELLPIIEAVPSAGIGEVSAQEGAG